MKNTLKRTLSLLMVACMLLAVLPFAAFAEEAPADGNIVFDFTGLVTEGSLSHELNEKVATGRNWAIAYGYRGYVISYPEYTEYAPLYDEASVGGDVSNKFWFVPSLKNIPAGVYTLKFTFAENKGELNDIEVYLIPRSALSKLNIGNITGQIKSAIPLATFNSGKTELEIPRVSISDDENNEYLLMFNFVPNEKGGMDGLKDTSVKLKTLTLEKSATPTPTVPDFNEPTEPVDAADSGRFPVVPVVIAAVAVVAVAAVVIIVLKKKKSAE